MEGFFHKHVDNYEVMIMILQEKLTTFSAKSAYSICSNESSSQANKQVEHITDWSFTTGRVGCIIEVLQAILYFLTGF